MLDPIKQRLSEMQRAFLPSCVVIALDILMSV